MFRKQISGFDNLIISLPPKSLQSRPHDTTSTSDLFYRVLDSFGFHRVLLPNRIRFKKVRFQGASRFWKVQTSNMLSVLFPEFVLHSVHSTWPHTFLTLALVHRTDVTATALSVIRWGAQVYTRRHLSPPRHAFMRQTCPAGVV